MLVLKTQKVNCDRSSSSGHGVVEDGKVDADEFLNTSRHVTPEATLSIGWNIAAEYFHATTSSTTETASSSSPTSSSTPLPLRYSDDDVRRMRDALTRNHVSSDASITFAIWSRFIPGSLDTLKWLTDEFPKSTVTIWGKAADASVEQVRTIYSILPKSRVFVDLPKEMREELMNS